MDYQFTDFFFHEEETISAAARLLAEAKRSFDCLELKQDEFEEIADGLLNVGLIASILDVERKQKIKDAVIILNRLVENAVSNAK